MTTKNILQLTLAASDCPIKVNKDFTKLQFAQTFCGRSTTRRACFSMTIREDKRSGVNAGVRNHPGGGCVRIEINGEMKKVDKVCSKFTKLSLFIFGSST